MSGRQIDQLFSLRGEKGAAADQKHDGELTRNLCEGGIDLLAGAGVEDLDLQSDGGTTRAKGMRPDVL
jgi:hypothetical protein